MKLLIVIDVPRIDKAVLFYKKAFGLHVKRRVENGFVELSGASSQITLLQEKNKSEAIPGLKLKRNYARHWTPIHLDFIVSDIDKAIKRATKAGAKLEGKIRKESYGYLANLSDPYGHGFCFIEFTGRGYDEISE